MKIQRTVLAAAAVLASLSIATLASAGYATTSEVTISGVSAWGAMGDARSSADSVQYIGCTLYAYPTSESGSCLARNASGTYLGCTASSDAQRDIIKSIKGQGTRVYFADDGSGYCSTIQVIESSSYVD